MTQDATVTDGATDEPAANDLTGTPASLSGPGLQKAREEAAEGQSFVRHELRTPLAVLQPVLDMLLAGHAGELEPKQRDYAAMLERNTARLAAMITSVVESGWLEVAAPPAAAERVDLIAVLRDLAAAVPALLEAAPPVDVQAPGGDSDSPGQAGRDAGVAVLADAYRLRLALRGILVNACTFTPPAGSVTVTVVPEHGGPVRIDVVDTGPGIPADELPHVCELGYQGRAGQALAGRGLGLGLYAARRLLQEAGGTIAVTSEAGEGTRVRVTLPAAPS